MPLVGESSWDAYTSKKDGSTQYTLSTHDWPPAARYLKIECLSSKAYATSGSFSSGGEAHIQKYSRRVPGQNFDQDIYISPPWNYEAWDPTMTGVVWYIQVNRGYAAYRLSIGQWS
jgi:hypothetical protein